MQFYLFIASGFGSGYLPKMPGTYGSIVGLILTYFMLLCGINTLFIAFLVSAVFGWYCSQRIMAQDGQVDPDPSFIVIDEIAGMMLTVLLVFWGIRFLSPTTPHLESGFNWSNTTQMLILFNTFWAFRFFDILKPTPIWQIEQYMEKIPELRAVGIMVDDLMAAVYAAIIVIPITMYLR